MGPRERRREWLRKDRFFSHTRFTILLLVSCVVFSAYYYSNIVELRVPKWPIVLRPRRGAKLVPPWWSPLPRGRLFWFGAMETESWHALKLHYRGHTLQLDFDDLGVAINATTYRCFNCGWTILDDAFANILYFVAPNTQLREPMQLPVATDKNIQIAVPYSGRPDRLVEFARMFANVRTAKESLTFTVFDGDDLPRLQAAIANILPLGVFKAIRIPGNFTRARALVALHEASLPDSILAVTDVDMEIKPQYFRNVRLFVAEGSTVYFPIVFSTYSPQSIDLVRRTFVNVEVESTGLWRPYGFGNYAMAGEDANRIVPPATQTTWGKEDNELVEMCIQVRNVIRMRDDGIMHQWHLDKNCSDIADTPRRRRCIASNAMYYQSSAATYITNELHSFPL